MLKSKPFKLWIFSGICFIFSGIMYLIEKEYLKAIIFIFLGGSYIVLGIANYKGNNKCNKNKLSDIDLENMRNELKNLIADGKKIKAIKKYRMFTGVSLKEAKEYIDLLSEKI